MGLNVYPSSEDCFQTVTGCQTEDAETWKFTFSIVQMESSFDPCSLKADGFQSCTTVSKHSHPVVPRVPMGFHSFK